MPVIVRKDGFSVVIYPDDHEPMHVHVKKAGDEVKVNAMTLELMSIKGSIGNKDVRKAVEIVAQNQALISQKWTEIHDRN